MTLHRDQIKELVFQSLIWVACPTGQRYFEFHHAPPEVSIPHMGCMPYGLCDRRSCARTIRFQSLIWVACPTGATSERVQGSRIKSFNPSYGLHALRAGIIAVWNIFTVMVTIPHRGCMPYGQTWSPGDEFAARVAIPHMGCMPYGLKT